MSENKNDKTTEVPELTPEQQEAVEANIRKTLDRLDKGKKIWKKIKTPLILAGAATTGFVLRGVLSRDECPFEADEVESDEYEDEYEDEE